MSAVFFLIFTELTELTCPQIKPAVLTYMTLLNSKPALHGDQGGVNEYLFTHIWTVYNEHVMLSFY